jgi:hypothetical protein
MIMKLSNSEVAFIIVAFISVSLWEYIMYQTRTTNYPYKQGFNAFSVIQWIGIAVGMISIFGLIKGFLVLLFFMILLQYLCHFTLGILWNSLAKKSYLLPTALFSIIVWITFGLGVLLAIF